MERKRKAVFERDDVSLNRSIGHCERSEAIQRIRTVLAPWLASSLRFSQ